MAANQTIENTEYDEFDDAELEATGKVTPAPEVEAPEADADPAAEPEVKAEAKGEEDGADEEEVDSKGRMIPRHRYNFQRDQRLAAERQAQQLQEELQKYQQYLAHLQQQQPAAEKVDYDAQISEIDQKIEEARADGDTSQIAKLRGQQRALERQAVIEEMQSRMPQQQQQIDPRELAMQAAESTKLETMVTQLEKQYPMLDETHESFDAELSEEIMSLYDTLRAKMPMSQAMERAVLYVTRANNVDPIDAPKKAGRRNVERNIKAAAAQPPEMDGVGMDSAKAGITRSVDIAKMSQEQFEALDDAEIEKLLAAA